MICKFLPWFDAVAGGLVDDGAAGAVWIFVMLKMEVESCAQTGDNFEIIRGFDQVDALAGVGLKVVEFVTEPWVKWRVPPDELIAAVVDLPGVAVLGETVVAPFLSLIHISEPTRPY